MVASRSGPSQTLARSPLLLLRLLLLLLLLASPTPIVAQCPDYTDYSTKRHLPYSNGTFELSYMRPDPACRTFNSSAVEAVVDEMQSLIADPDLYRLFQNAFPNTLDTAIKWKGYAANNSAEELTFVITGDINAMWLRDSAHQLQSYLSLLAADQSADSLASLYRGVINLQSRYILTDPFCNSFQPPPESGLGPAVNGAAADDVVSPGYSNTSVFECKYELDSLAAFLEVSANYFSATRDAAFFARFQWLDAVQAVVHTANAMRTSPTYAANGSVLASPYTFERTTDRASETLENNGLGSPVAHGTGLVRSAFRPSDDATIFQLLIPANMMFSRYLASAALIVEALEVESRLNSTRTGTPPPPPGLAEEMKDLASSIRAAVQRWGVVTSQITGKQVYAYEVDGFGSIVAMDDANIPSLLSAPFLGYLDANDTVYQNTREIILDEGYNGNPYFMRGPVINAVGGPHDGPGFAWPMASIMRIYTSGDEAEITQALGEIVSSTDGLGLIHESINTFNQSDWTRQW
ncbi:hypothetical protein BD289DRAFT_377788, partial [Coniella lustricola]